MKRHSGPGVIRRSFAWRALEEPARQAPIPRPGTVHAHELGNYAFCSQAHRIETQRLVLTLDGGSPQGADSVGRPIPPFQPDRTMWDTPARLRGRQAHDRMARRAKHDTGAWGARAALFLCMLAAAGDLIVRFG